MFCADASLAAKWVLPEQHRDLALALLRATLAAGEPIVAPHFLRVEVTNILRQRLRRPDAPLTLAEATERLRTFLALPLMLITPDALHERAFRLADAYGLPAAYDAHYVVLAQELGCDLWTDDRRLLRELAGRLPFVRWIGDYAEQEPAP
jgi:predicted nucleic acid-binding protein